MTDETTTEQVPETITIDGVEVRTDLGEALRDIQARVNALVAADEAEDARALAYGYMELRPILAAFDGGMMYAIEQMLTEAAVAVLQSDDATDEQRASAEKLLELKALHDAGEDGSNAENTATLQ